MIGRVPGWLMIHLAVIHLAVIRLGSGRCRYTHRKHTRGEPTEYGLHLDSFQKCRQSIHAAMAIMPRFSVSETKPSGTRLEPPTQAHLISRFWM